MCDGWTDRQCWLVAHCHREGTLCFSQFAVRPTVLAERVRRWLLESYAISLVAQLLEVADQRLQPPRVTAMRGEDAARVGIQRARIFTRLLWRAFPLDRATLLPARH